MSPFPRPSPALFPVLALALAAAIPARAAQYDQRLANLSTRAQVGTGSNVMITGFVIQQGAPKQILIRAVGARLATAPFNLTGVLANPLLQVYNSDGVLVLTNDNSTGNDQIIAAPGIKSVADLKGKRVAAEEGTVDHYLLLLGLKKAGLSTKDITFVPLETGAAAAAFVAGKVDAVGVFAPFTTQALKRQGSTTLFSSKDFPGAISDHLVCRKEFVAQHPEKVQKLVDAWFATLKLIKTEPGPTLAIMAKRAAVSEADYKAYDAGTTILTLAQNQQVFKPGTNMQALPYAAKEIGSFLQEVGLAKTAPPLAGLLQPQFVDAVK